MSAVQTGGAETLRVEMDVPINAPMERVWELITTRLNDWMHGGEDGTGGKLDLTLEAWPGGRLWRDLGEKGGHLWAFVQVVKPPYLLELYGPMFTSTPTLSHVTFRLVEDGEHTRLKFSHRASGPIPADMASGVTQGWQMTLEGNLKTLCEGSMT